MIIRLHYRTYKEGQESEAFWQQLEDNFGNSGLIQHTNEEKIYTHPEYVWRLYDTPGVKCNIEYVFNTLDVTPKTPAVELWCQLNAPKDAVILEDPECSPSSSTTPPHEKPKKAAPSPSP